MTAIRYNECDRCGVKDNELEHVWHYEIKDVFGVFVAHLCRACLIEVTPRSVITQAIAKQADQETAK